VVVAVAAVHDGAGAIREAVEETGLVPAQIRHRLRRVTGSRTPYEMPAHG
jgi:8-oxo-dGTP pyrophosphatase MutT (NUDIX family)